MCGITAIVAPGDRRDLGSLVELMGDAQRERGSCWRETALVRGADRVTAADGGGGGGGDVAADGPNATIAIHLGRHGHAGEASGRSEPRARGGQSIIATPCGRGLIAFDGVVRDPGQHADVLAGFGWTPDGDPAAAAGDGPNRSVERAAQIVLARLLTEGPEGLSRVDGDFAFTAIDFRRRVFMCGRDRWGVRPLYWWAAPWGGIALASEIKAFTALPSWQARLNGPRAWDFLRYGVLDHTDETMFEGVGRIEPGVVLTLPLPGCVQSPRLEFDPSGRDAIDAAVADAGAAAAAKNGQPVEAVGGGSSTRTAATPLDAAAEQKWTDDVARVAGGTRRVGRLGRRGRGATTAAIRDRWFDPSKIADESRLLPGKSVATLTRRALATSVMRRLVAATNGRVGGEAPGTSGQGGGSPAARDGRGPASNAPGGSALSGASGAPAASKNAADSNHAPSIETSRDFAATDATTDPCLPGLWLSGGIDSGSIAVLLMAAVRRMRSGEATATDDDSAIAEPLNPNGQPSNGRGSIEASADAAAASDVAAVAEPPLSGPVATGWTWTSGSRRDVDFGSAKASAGAAGLVQERCSARDVEWTTEFDESIWRHDEPPATPAFLARNVIARSAAAAGNTVLFDGTGADETLGGSPWAHRSVRAGLLRRGSLTDLLVGVASVRPGRTIPVSKQLRRAVERSLPGPGAILEEGPGGPMVELSRGSRASDPVARRAPGASNENPFGRMPGLRRGLRSCSVELLRRATLPQQLHAIDRAAAAHGIHVDLPYLCPGFVSLALALPDERKIADGRSKLALRQGMVGRLPTLSLRHEHRPPFETNLVEWLDATKRPVVLAWIDEGDRRAGTLFKDGVLDHIREVVRSPRDASDRERRQAWRVISFFRWIERFNVQWD
ncbi:MAG: asparagine synthase-related protein [Phycisphaerales bacterium]